MKRGILQFGVPTSISTSDGVSDAATVLIKKLSVKEKKEKLRQLRRNMNLI